MSYEQTARRPARPATFYVAAAAGWVLFGLAVIVLAGWAFDLLPLEKLFSTTQAMKANSAVAALLAGVALLRRNHRDMPIYAAAVSLIGALTLGEYYWLVNFGIDELFVRDTHFVWFAGRMSQYTSIGFILLGISILPVRSKYARVRELSRTLAALTGALGILALMSHLYDRRLPGLISPQANVSVPTALALVIGAVGVLYAHPSEGIVRLMHARNAGGKALRRLAPAGLVVTVLLGFIVRNAQEEYHWDMGFSLALVAAGVGVCLVAAIVLTGAGLERDEFARHESEQRFRQADNSTPGMIWMTDAEKR